MLISVAIVTLKILPLPTHIWPFHTVTIGRELYSQQTNSLDNAACPYKGHANSSQLVWACENPSKQRTLLPDNQCSIVGNTRFSTLLSLILDLH